MQADGVDVIQFDEPAFNVFMDEVPGWGIEALHRAIDGLTCTTAVHICYGYGIKANIDWKNALGGEWRQYEKIFPALAKSRIGQVSLEAINSRVPLKLLSLLDGKDVLVGVIDVATDAVETPEQVAQRDRRGYEIRAEGAHRRLHQLRHGADAARHRRGQADGARRRREAGARNSANFLSSRQRNEGGHNVLPPRPAHHVHQFGDLAALVGLVAARDRVLDAMGDVVAQDFLLDPAQRGAHRADLRHDVDAVALVLDHAGEPAHLALDAVEPLERRRLAVLAHAVYIPPRGIDDKSRRNTTEP